MQEGGRPTARFVLVVLVMAVAETAWALYAAETEASIDLLLFYAVLAAASAVFFVPGLTVTRAVAPSGRPEEAPETKG